MARFSDDMKVHFFDWAKSDGIVPGALETRQGKSRWVLEEGHKRLNISSENWWRRIVTGEHQWARALNSSQCFAVNLFAPLAEDPDLARSLLQRLVPGLKRTADDEISHHFEHTPDGTAACRLVHKAAFLMI